MPKIRSSREQESYPGHFGNSVPTAFRLKMPSALETQSVSGIRLRQETVTAPRASEKNSKPICQVSWTSRNIGRLDPKVNSRYMGYPKILLGFKKKKRKPRIFPLFHSLNKQPEIFHRAYCIIHESGNTCSHNLYARNYKSGDQIFTFQNNIFR